jgi:hypothetical protein
VVRNCRSVPGPFDESLDRVDGLSLFGLTWKISFWKEIRRAQVGFNNSSLNEIIIAVSPGYGDVRS